MNSTRFSTVQRFATAWPTVWILSHGACFLPVALGQSVQPTSDEPPSLPTATLIRVGELDELTRRRDTLTEIGELLTRSRNANEPDARLMGLHDAAQRLLADALEPAVTAKMLELPATHGLEESQAAELLDQVDGLLKEIASELQENDVKLPKDVASGFRRIHRSLEAFASAFRAYLLPSTPETRNRAALQLSPVLEDQDSVVATAAGLWQALLRSESGDSQAALVVLPYVFSELDRRHLPWDYFARLQRIRVIAATGGFPTALALSTQIEDRAGQGWPPGGPDRAAERSALWLQMVLLRKWWGALPPDSEQRRWCARRIHEIAEEHFSEDAALARLHPAIPRLEIGVPDVGNRK